MPYTRSLTILGHVTWQPLLGLLSRPHFYQTRSAWSMDQGSNKNQSPVNNVAPTVTKFCVMWEGQALPHDTKFGNCRDKIVDSRAFLSWSLIHGSSWSGLIKLGPGSVMLSSLSYSFKDKAPVDLIYECLLFKWLAETWQHDRVPGQ